MSWDEIMQFMFQRCGDCGCLLNNSPECEDGCIHRNGCPDGPEYGPAPGMTQEA